MNSKLPKKFLSRSSPAPITPPVHKASIISICTGCKKTTSRISNLNQCTKCKLTTYCSRRCRTSDWTSHKRICKEPIPTSRSTLPTQSLIRKSFGCEKTSSTRAIDPRILVDPVHWLAGLPESTCYHIIIDTYRLRLDAEWGSAERFYGSDYEKLLTHFHEFLKGVNVVNVLPSWWKEENMRACAKIAIDEKAEACIMHTVEDMRKMVVEKYGNPEMPGKLMAIAERVYGWCDTY